MSIALWFRYITACRRRQRSERMTVMPISRSAKGVRIVAFDMSNGAMNNISVRPMAKGVFALLAAAVVAVALIYALPALAQEPNAGPLGGFTLVDASDQTELATLTDSGSVELADPDGGSYGIRADIAEGETVGSVRLELSGAKSVGPKTENLAPYSLYGDHRSGAARHLDGESLPAGSYTLTATAYAESGLGGDELGTLEVSFTVSRANSAPAFGSATYNFSVAEDAAVGTAVGSVSATDADDDGLTYSIETGNGEGKFAMDGSSGAITVAGELDHETTASYALTVQADDGNGGTATATVNITVTDVNDAPSFGSATYDFSVAEDAAVGTAVGGVSATDADDDGLTYSIESGNGEGKFAMDGSSGALTVAGELDHETTASYALTVQADDGNGGTATATVNITVTDVNDAPSFGSATYDFSVAEDAAVGTAVGGVSATDADDDGLTYSIESGNGEGKFAMDGSSGAVTTTGALDHETTASYTLTVQADDGNGGTATATVNITVTDVNDAPEFGSETYDFTITEDAATGTGAGSVSATDADGHGLTYSIETGNGEVKFAIDGSSGAVTTTGALDHETTASYTLTVQADDGNGGTATATVNIAVTDVNDAPAFGSATYNFSVAEDAAVGTAVGGVSATDADDDGLTYSIETGNGDGKFAMDGSSGAITVAGALDHAATASYALTVQADDGNGGTATATVNVSVTDVAESTTGPLAGFMLVDASDQTELATLTAGASVELSDPDGGSYAVRADVDANANIGSVRLALSGAKTVSRTESVAPYSLYGDSGADALDGASLPAGSYTMTATAYAESNLGGDELGSLEVSFTVTQANRAPEFASSTYNFSVAEDAATGTAVGTVSASDEDSDGLTYSIESGNGDGKFAIDGSSGAVTTAGALDHATTPSYALTVQADDGNGAIATATVNVAVAEVVANPDGARDGAVSLGAQSPSMGRQYFRGESLDRANGDEVDYYKFHITERLELGLGVRDQTIDLDSWLEDADGNVVIQSAPPADPSKDQTVEWLRTTIDAGTYYIKVQAMEDGKTDYYLRYQVKRPESRLESFRVTGVNLDGFESEVLNYARNVAGDVDKVTVTAAAVAGDAAVDITPADADTVTDGHQVDLVDDGVTTITVAVTHRGDTRNYTVELTQLAGTTGALSDDATLSALTLSGVTLSPTFASDVTQYSYTLTETQMTDGFTTTVTATPGSAYATMTITPADADGAVAGHQVAIPAGRTPSTVSIKVAPQDGSAARTYTVRLVTVASLATVDGPAGLWSDGVTMWVSDDGAAKARLLAYDLATFERDSSKDFTPASLGIGHVDVAEQCGNPSGIWSDGNTMWVLDTVYGRLLAYDMHGTGLRRDPSSDIVTRGLEGGIWSDGTTIWGASLLPSYFPPHFPMEVSAYNLFTGKHMRSEGIPSDALGRADNGSATGIWSDGTTMWVADAEDDKVYAYTLRSKRRDSGKEFLLAAGNTSPVGIWSDGTTMWVLDANKKIYGYLLPAGHAAAPRPVLNPGEALAADSITHESATLAWDVPEQPEGVSIEGLYLEYVRSGSSDRVTKELVSSNVGETLPSSWTNQVSNLSASSTYRWRVTLHTNLGKVHSKLQTLRTKSPPKPPEGLAGFLDSGDVVLTWTVPEQPDWVQVERIEVSRDPGMDAGEGRLSLQDGATLYQYTDDDVEASTEYEYEIHMVTGTGTYRSDVVTLTTGAADQAQLAAPTDLQVANGHGSTMLSWSAPSGVSLSGYQVLRREEGVDAAGEFRILVPNTGSTETGYTDEGAEPETTYEYKVRGIDGANLTAASGSVTITTPFAAFPDAKELDLESRTLGEWHSYQDEMIVSNREIAPVQIPVYFFILTEERRVSFKFNSNGWPGSDLDGVGFDVRNLRGNVLFNGSSEGLTAARLSNTTMAAGTYYLVARAGDGEAYRATRWAITIEHRLD